MSVTAPRCLYRGKEDFDAETQRFETVEDVEKALANGWRMKRKIDAPAPKKIDGCDPHVENAGAVKDHAETLTNVADLEALKAAEVAHPTFEGGRVSVLKAIDDKIDALKA